MNDTSHQTLKPEQLAERWETSTATLANMRYLGSGPDYLKIGAAVRYPLASIEAYEAANTVQVQR